MNYNDIPEFPRAHYEIDVDWKDLKEALVRWEKSYNLNLSPDYQRAHVWTLKQKRAYIEYCLMGGEVAKSLTFNCPGWQYAAVEGDMELIDGKQRLQAVIDFLCDRVTIFGGYSFSQMTGHMRGHKAGFKFRVCSLRTRAEVLQLYLNINAGGTPHTQKELNKVRALLKKEPRILGRHAHSVIIDEV
jgi:hypothetical protein